MLLCWHPSTCSCSTPEWGEQTDRSTLLRTVKPYLNSRFSIISRSLLFYESTLYTKMSVENLLLKGSRLESWYKRWGTWRPAPSGSWWMEAAQLCCQGHKLISHPAERPQWHSGTWFRFIRSSMTSLFACFWLISRKCCLWETFVVDADMVTKALTIPKLASYLQMHRSSPSQCWVLWH